MTTSSLISIVIPCYNGAHYIAETLNSILSQAYQKFEIIVVDDGSFDETNAIINRYVDNRIKYVYQTNQGVSVARNNGFKLVRGQYVVFFDADDLMSFNFLTERVSILIRDSVTDFCCSQIKKIDEMNNIIGNDIYNGYSDKFSHDILSFNQKLTTCPSNYLFRTSFLINNKILFNENLSSTADKYFLLECDCLGKGYQINNNAFLLYRISAKGMSQVLNIGLINDNIQFEKEILILLKNIGFTKKLINDFLAKNRLSISISFLKISIYNKSFTYFIKSIISNPKVLVQYLFNKLKGNNFRFIN
ncbi:MAG: glycosyltransferase family 2 protein [Bacteroidota bacterium]